MVVGASNRGTYFRLLSQPTVLTTTTTFTDADLDIHVVVVALASQSTQTIKGGKVASVLFEADVSRGDEEKKKTNKMKDRIFE